MSHTDLANRPGLKRAALSRIVNDLLKKRAGQEGSVRSTPNGQPPEPLEVIPRSGVFGVIDMGEIHINAAVQFALEQENAPILEVPEGIYLPALVYQTLRRWSSIRY